MNEKKPLISVIVPIYQVEAYLEECIDSILQQTYSNLEIILVDDGSTDKCPMICDEYQKRDCRIRVIHKANGGLVSARKAGLQIASGELLAYVDSDDWLEFDMYEQMVSVMIREDADVVITGHVEENNQSISNLNFIPDGTYRGQELVDKVFSRMLYEPSIGKWGLSPACWDKLMKRDVVYSYQMNVDDRIWDGEDHAFIYSVILEAKCVSILDCTPYHHRIRQGSVATAFDARAFERFSYLFQHLRSQFSGSKFENVLMAQFPYQMRWFLIKHIYTELQIPHYDDMYLCESYVFPFQRIEKGKRIVLYGAGDVGHVFWRQIKTTGYCHIVVWVAKNYEVCMNSEFVQNPCSILSLDYDYVVIAVLREKVAESIEHDLVEMGVDKRKIIYENPLMKRIE